MKKSFLLYLILFTSAILYAQGRYEINPNKSEIAFVFKAKYVDGTIGDIQSESIINLDDIESSQLKGSVSVSSLDTGNFLWDGHLMWEKYFNRKEHPRIYLESTSITKNGNTYSVNALLTLKGVQNAEVFMASRSRKTITVKGTINIDEYGINIEKEPQKNKVEITMTFTIKTT